MMKTVKEFPYLLIYWDEETQAVILQWRGGFKGRNLKEGLLTGLSEVKKHGTIAGWIGDTSDIGVISLEEQAWIDKEWFPQFLQTGVKSMVVVQPKDLIAKLSVDRVMTKVPNTQLTVFNCTSIEEGCAWLRKQA